MSLFKRTFTGLYARLDSLVGDIENHDAQIQAAIDQQKQKLAAATIQLRRLEQSEQRLSQQLTELANKTELWSERAVRAANTDESQALLCLQRRQRVQQQRQQLAPMREQLQQSIAKMRTDIAQCERALAATRQKQQLLRARQSSAEAMQLAARDSDFDVDAIEQSFDRWELKIAEREPLAGAASFIDGVDSLECEYQQQENEQQLRQQLEDLLQAHRQESSAGEAKS